MQPIPINSERGQAMQLAAMKEIATATQFRGMPGYFCARLARGRTKEERMNDPKWGLTADELRKVSQRGGAGIPIYADKHQRLDQEPQIGRTLAAKYNEDDGYLYIHGKLDVGTNVHADRVAQRRKNGELQYVSVGFTLPDDRNPIPLDQVESSIDHVSLVNRPHEPHAKILIGHSTTDDGNRHRIVILSSEDPIQDHMSAAPAPADNKAPENPPSASAPAAPSASPAYTADQIRLLVSTNEKQTQELASLRARVEGFEKHHSAQMQPLVESCLSAFKEDDKMDEGLRAAMTSLVTEAARDRESGKIVSYLADRLSQIKALQAHQNQSTETANLLQQWDRGRSQLVPPVGGHSAAPDVQAPTDFAKKFISLLNNASNVIADEYRSVNPLKRPDEGNLPQAKRPGF